MTRICARLSPDDRNRSNPIRRVVADDDDDEAFVRRRLVEEDVAVAVDGCPWALFSAVLLRVLCWLSLSLSLSLSSSSSSLPLPARCVRRMRPPGPIMMPVRRRPCDMIASAMEPMLLLPFVLLSLPAPPMATGAARANAACWPPLTPCADNTACTTSSDSIENSDKGAESGASSLPLQMSRRYLSLARLPLLSSLLPSSPASSASFFSSRRFTMSFRMATCACAFTRIGRSALGPRMKLLMRSCSVSCGPISKSKLSFSSVIIVLVRADIWNDQDDGMIRVGR
mmetsp:Transcript_22407/g.63499  ORF Transcript_22407/g.63499 Transcript_22407/m.63499 type:complete len:284 (-) Transcript_22407:30-881(-)